MVIGRIFKNSCVSSASAKLRKIFVSGPISNAQITARKLKIFSGFILIVMLHKEILSAAQQDLLPLIRGFGTKFTLCGGTAIALYIGHRASIDFDLFTCEKLNAGALRKKLAETDRDFSVIV